MNDFNDISEAETRKIYCPSTQVIGPSKKLPKRLKIWQISVSNRVFLTSSIFVELHSDTFNHIIAWSFQRSTHRSKVTQLALRWRFIKEPRVDNFSVLHLCHESVWTSLYLADFISLHNTPLRTTSESKSIDRLLRNTEVGIGPKRYSDWAISITWSPTQWEAPWSILLP